MWPYWVVASATLAISAVARFVASGNRRLLVLLLAVLLACFAGLRYETGWDWEAYDYFFANLQRVRFGDSSLTRYNPFDFEWGFWWVSYVFTVLGVRPYLGIAVATVCLVLFSAHRQLGRGICFFGILYLFYGYFHNFSIIRQGLACGLFCLAISRIRSREPGWFLAYIAGASLVHQSALLLAPLYWVCGRRSKSRITLFIVASSVPFVALPLMSHAPSLVLPYVLGSGDAVTKIAAYIESESAAFKVGFSLKYAELLLLLLASVLPTVEARSRDSQAWKSPLSLDARQWSAFDVFRNLTLVELAIYAVFNDISILYERFTVYFEYSHAIFVSLLALSVRSVGAHLVMMLIMFAIVVGRYYQLIESPARVPGEKSHHERFIPYRNIVTDGAE